MEAGKALLGKGSFSRAGPTEIRRALSPLRASFYQRKRDFRGQKKRTSVAKAGFSSVIYSTAEAVPFPETTFLAA
jgi:hypothetical protein